VTARPQVDTLRHERFAELDALRGFAALAVVFYHYSLHSVRYYHDFPFRFTAGAYGVELFFCISGFVIFWTLERSRTITDFAFSRFTRLFPTYWTAIAVMGTMSLAHLGDPFWPRGYLVNATMLQTFLRFPDVDVVYWTLAVELVFYFWMAMLYAAGQLERIVLASAIWLALSAVSGIASSYVGVPGWLNTYLILPHLPFFIADTMFYLIWKARPQRGHIATILFAGIAAALTGGWRKALVAGVVFSVFSLAVTGRLRLIVNPVTIWLGAISYALYLTHRQMGHEVLAALNRLGVPSTISVALAIICALALASAITYGVEQPALALLRGWYKRRKVRLSAN
jgi:peptidoglycan/LPS O-acetylase OafA/YrhL